MPLAHLESGRRRRPMTPSQETSSSPELQTRILGGRKESTHGTAAGRTTPQLATALPAVTLVLGGARSGKSRFAEGLIAAAPGPWVYLATGEAGDAEMAARIRHHRERRGEGWITIEETLDLSGALQRAAGEGRAILVDCLTLWVSNLMAVGRGVTAETERLIAALPQARSSNRLRRQRSRTRHRPRQCAGPRLPRRGRARQPGCRRCRNPRLFHRRRPAARDEG